MRLGTIMSGLTPLAVAGALTAVTADPASAVAMRLSDDAGNSVTVEDNGPGDDLATDGFIQYGSTGVSPFEGWGAVTAEGSACLVACPRLNGQLNAESNQTDAFLMLEVTETDLMLMETIWRNVHSLSGVADGNVTMEAFWDPSNAAFARTNSIGGAYKFDSEREFSAFSANLTDSANGESPFSMTTVITFNHELADQASLASSAASVSAVPLPAALPLLGAAAGLLGLAGARRRG